MHASTGISRNPRKMNMKGNDFKNKLRRIFSLSLSFSHDTQPRERKDKTGFVFGFGFRVQRRRRTARSDPGQNPTNRQRGLLFDLLLLPFSIRI